MFQAFENLMRMITFMKALPKPELRDTLLSRIVDSFDMNEVNTENGGHGLSNVPCL